MNWVTGSSIILCTPSLQFSKDVNTVKKLVDYCLSSELSASLRPRDAVSALGPMYNSHEISYLPKMQVKDCGEYSRELLFITNSRIHVGHIICIGLCLHK